MSGIVAVCVPGWSAASLTLTIGAGSDTWTPASDDYDIVSAVTDLIGWLDGAGRPWHGSASFTGELLDLDPWFGISLTCSASCTWSPDAELQTLLGWPSSGQTATTIYTSTGVWSTVVCDVAVADWLPRIEGAGATSRAGSFVVDSQANALRPARLELLGDEARMSALAVALSGASDPVSLRVVRSREAWGSAAWDLVYPGDIPRPGRDGEVYRLELEVYG